MRLTRVLSVALSAVAVAVGAFGPRRGVDASPDATRVRKNWEQLSSTQRATYLEAVGDAMKSGKHLTFTKIYMDANGLERVRATCGAPAWHRKWLYGYENMLRSLDAKYADVTLPYWNFFHDSAKRMSSRSTCNDVLSCSNFLTDFGGSEGDDYELPYTINGVFIAGNCVKTGIAQYGCTDASGANCEKCIPRGDWDVDMSTFEFGASAFPEVLRHASKSATPFDTLRESMQTRFHWNLHNLLGGIYETPAAAFDPVFIGHYAMLDQIYHLFKACHKDATITGTCQTTDGEAIGPNSTIPMQLDGKAVEDHVDTAAYFTDVGTTFADLEASTDYEIDPFLETLLTEFSGNRCTRAAVPSLTWSKKNLMVDTNVTTDFAHAMALCGKSNLTGDNTGDEAPYTAVVCELMARAQNGAFTNFSTPIRETFKAPAALLPSCIDILAAIVTDTIELTIAEECRAAILKETGESTADFVVKTSGFAVITRGEDGGVKYLKAKKKR